MQSKLDSFKESLTNVMIGYITALVSQILIFHLFDIYVSIGDNLLIGLYFTAISIVRSYVIRRWYNRRVRWT